MSVSIVIPMYGGWQLTHNLLWDIWDCCMNWNNSLEIIVIDDASGEDIAKGAKFWKRSGTWDNLHFFTARKNVGFGRNSNRGLRLASGDIKILMSTDIVMNRTFEDTDFIAKICTFINADPNQLIGARLLDFDTGWNKFGNKVFPYLEGWMLAGTKEFWKECKFDPIYGMYDYEDVDISTQAVEKGYSLKALNLPLVHLGGVTIRRVHGDAKRRLQTEKNRDIFRKKWIK